MRLYSFGNMYLMGIQAGIQCQHATAELFNKYCGYEADDYPTPEKGLLLEWAEDYKTTILLNGGDWFSMKEILRLLCSSESKYPFAEFYEEGLCRDGVLSNICLVVPEKIYQYKDNLAVTEGFFDTLPVHVDGALSLFDQSGCRVDYTPWEKQLAELIASKRLMA